MIGLGFMIRFGLVISSWGFIIRCRGFESFTSLTVDGLLVVAGAEVLIEDGAVPAVKRVLASIRITEMIDLNFLQIISHFKILYISDSQTG